MRHTVCQVRWLAWLLWRQKPTTVSLWQDYYQILLAFAHEIYVMLSVCGSCLTKLSELFQKKKRKCASTVQPNEFQRLNGQSLSQKYRSRFWPLRRLNGYSFTPFWKLKTQRSRSVSKMKKWLNLVGHNSAACGPIPGRVCLCLALQIVLFCYFASLRSVNCIKTNKIQL